MRLLLAAMALAGSAFGCTLTEPCSVAANFSWDSRAIPDSRAGTWGNADSWEFKIPFVNVPEGMHVRVLRIQGDLIAGPRDAQARGILGVLAGATNSTPWASRYVAAGAGSEGTLLYIQNWGLRTRTPFDVRVARGELNSDGILCVKLATFLDTTGASIHMEVTFGQIVFAYEENLNGGNHRDH